jgi:hypothetical protein
MIPNNLPQTSTSVPANVISVLYQQEMDNAVQERLLTFLAHYRAAQRSIWSGNDFFFNREWHFIIDRLVRDERLRDYLPSVLFMVITLVEAAIGEALTNFDFQAGPLREIAPEELRNILAEVDAQFHQVREFNREGRRANERFDPGDVPGLPEDITTTEFPVGEDETPFSAEEFWERWEAAHAAAHDQVLFEPGGDGQLWFEGDSSIVKEVEDFIRTGTNPKMLMGSPMLNDYVYGAAHREDDLTVIIRLVSLTRNYVTLKTYVEGLIARLRFSKTPALDWKREYLGEENQKPFVVGESWDKYPYPNPNNSSLLGITAWLSVDGRAQIIVRKG